MSECFLNVDTGFPKGLGSFVVASLIHYSLKVTGLIAYLCSMSLQGIVHFHDVFLINKYNRHTKHFNKYNRSVDRASATEAIN